MKSTTSGFQSILFIYLLSFFGFTVSFSQTAIPDQIPIWDGAAPGSENVNLTEQITDRSPATSACYLNRTVGAVQTPTIKVFKPANPNGTSVILCPGGGYLYLTYDKEGTNIAEWYNDRDITAFVLKSRLPVDGHANRAYVPLQDAQRAIRYIRYHAAEFGIDPDKIGIMGGSAGGHVAACASTLYNEKVYEPKDAVDAVSARPDFTVLMYPVVSFQDNIVHVGSRANLLGNTITQELKDFFSPEKHMTADTPPAFLFHSNQDTSVPPANSQAYADSLTAAGGSSTVKFYTTGGHGIGKCEAAGTDFANWPLDLNNWLETSGLTGTCEGTAPTITFTGEDTVTISASAASNYQWLKDNAIISGATEATYTTSTSGKYRVVSTGQRTTTNTGCELYSNEITIDLCVGSYPEITTSGDNGEILTSNKAARNRWFLNGTEIPDATKKTFTATESGEYTVAYIGARTFSKEECLYFSEPVTVKFVLGNTPKISQLYPNPSEDKLFINPGNLNLNKTTYRIYNQAGALMIKGNILIENENHFIDISRLEAGLYMLQLHTPEGTFVEKFLKD